MEQLLRSLALGGAGQRAADNPQHPDSSETVNISALALLKMMRHSRAGVPLEVMGLMLGNFVDDYTINVVDVFAMPQSGTSVTVESVDPVYQTKHMDLLKMAGRTEMVVGWYHSHPGFGCWLSGVDCQTQQSFEALHPRAVAVVVDPIQSVKGKVVIDAFRSINPLSLGSRGLAPTSESRQVTSNLGHLERPSIVSTLHGLGTRYYSLNIGYKMGAKDQKMLMALNKKSWLDGLALQKYDKRAQENDERMAEMIKLTNLFTKDTLASKPATKKDAKKQQIEKYGKLNSRQRLEQSASSMMCENIVQQLGAMVNSKACQ